MRNWGAGEFWRYSERLGQARLTQDSIGGVTAGNTDGHSEIPLRDRAVPDFVAALALPDERASRRTQQLPQSAVELRSHSGGGRFGFPERCDL